MINVLITGVAGFVGSNLADKLIKRGGYKITGIDNLSYGIREQVPHGVDFHQLDIRDRSIYPLFKDIDFVFHLAAKNCISDCQLDPVETSDINITGTINVFEACRRSDVIKVIYAESSAIYERSSIYPTPETEINPQSFYSLSKLSSMYFANGYSEFFNLKMTALRYFCVYGPRQDYRRSIPPLFSSFIIKLLKNEQPVVYGNGEKRRDFIHVDDINEFHIQCMEDYRTDGKTFNLGYGKNYSVNEIYEIIKNELEKNILPIYKPDLPGEAYQTLADITLAKKIGWFPKIDIISGIKTSIDFITKEIENGNL